MAYAIIDVPSTGNVRLPQRRFLEFRQTPLLLASLVLTAWWAVFCTVHGSEPFKTIHWLPKFVAFTLASYFSGELLATAVPSFRKRKQKARPGRIWRFVAITASAALAGFCLWAIATRMFLNPEKIEVRGNPCKAIEIRKTPTTPTISKQKITIQPGTQGFLIQRSLLRSMRETLNSKTAATRSRFPVNKKLRSNLALMLPSRITLMPWPCPHPPDTA